MSVFGFETYKDFLKDLFKAHAAERGYQAKVARAIGCQPSYLSQVMTMKADLNQDHAVALAEFLGFNDLESSFLLNLILKSRARTPRAREFFEAQLAKLRREQKRLSSRLRADDAFAGGLETIYHSSWVYAALHIATSIRGQTAGSLAAEFRLPVSEVNRSLKVLESYGLVASQGDSWSYVKGAGHLPDQSPMTLTNHTQWRLKSLSNFAELGSRDLRYSSVFTMSFEDAEALREEILRAVESWRDCIAPSEPETTRALLCDFFAV